MSETVLVLKPSLILPTTWTYPIPPSHGENRSMEAFFSCRLVSFLGARYSSRPEHSDERDRNDSTLAN